MEKGLSWDYDDFWTQKEARSTHSQPDGLGCWWAVCGKSGGYWVEIARSRPEREAEARHSTKFGQHWAGSRQRPSGRLYTILRSPYDPAPSWNGRTAFPPGVGPAAPGRWPAEAPDGLRPYEYKKELVLASRVVTDQLRLSDDPHSHQWLRDLKGHIRERAVEWGAPYQNENTRRVEFRSPKYAHGIRCAELEGIALYRRHDQLRWFIDAPLDEEKVDERELDSAIADAAGFKFEAVDNTVAERRKRYGRPLRERRKAGRKPIGLIAQTTAERGRKHRQRKALKFKAPATHERLPAGTVQPSPLELAVPVDLSTRVRNGDD